MKPNLARLRQVLRVLADVRDEQFDLKRYYRGDPNKPDCGTVGCAVGWAAADSWFNQRGLSLQPRHGDPLENKLVYVRRSDKFEYDKAVEKFFGLDDKGQRPFYPDGYRIDEPTRRQVMRRIRDLIRRVEART